MLTFATKVAALSLAVALPTPSQTQLIEDVPSPAELQVLVRGSWPSFAALIRRQDGLSVTPNQFKGLSQALCRRSEMKGAYECVSLVEYELPTGIKRSSLLRHNVDRDDKGRLSDVIVIREMPPSR
jgi:hypothetical protein